jgi:hypothetical protein
VILVGEERERESVLAPKLRVPAGTVRADAEHDGAALLELAPRIADPTGLARAAGRVVLGVEIENDRRAPQGGERDLLTGVARQREVRRRCTFIDHRASSLLVAMKQRRRRPKSERSRPSGRRPTSTHERDLGVYALHGSSFSQHAVKG